MFPQHQTELKPEFESKKRDLILTAPGVEWNGPVETHSISKNGIK